DKVFALPLGSTARWAFEERRSSQNPSSKSRTPPTSRPANPARNVINCWSFNCGPGPKIFARATQKLNRVNAIPASAPAMISPPRIRSSHFSPAGKGVVIVKWGVPCRVNSRRSSRPGVIDQRVQVLFDLGDPQHFLDRRGAGLHFVPAVGAQGAHPLLHCLLSNGRGRRPVQDER